MLECEASEAAICLIVKCQTVLSFTIKNDQIYDRLMWGWDLSGIHLLTLLSEHILNSICGKYYFLV